MEKLKDFYEIETKLAKIYQKYYHVLELYSQQDISLEIYQKLSDRYSFQLEETLLLENEFWKNCDLKRDFSFFSKSDAEDISFLFDSNLNPKKRIWFLLKQRAFLMKLKQFSSKDFLPFYEKKKIYDQFCAYEFVHQFFRICDKNSTYFIEKTNFFFQFYRNLLYYSGSFQEYFKEIRKLFKKSGFSFSEYDLYKSLVVQDNFELLLETLNELDDPSFECCFRDADFQILFSSYVQNFEESSLVDDILTFFIEKEERRKKLTSLMKQIPAVKLHVVK